ncbi:hypothetical protein HF086_005493 [Spodoptera exigua]|uniref:Uncharacterized protein n=1 Tax=Spodoptera exigua TaxID=7107 RepID=A0A922SHG3_SPOEX|nr:hypothetical protein HF086_005493 [Spodoptera exigua]
MDFLRVCRICSIMDVKMHDLRSFPLNFFYEFVVGTNPIACNLPPYACYECAALVMKFYNFRQKCLRNQDVLNGITDIYGKLNPVEVRAINRKELNITSNLTITHLECVDTTCDVSTNELVKLEPEEDEDKVKVEDHNYASIDHVDDVLSSDDDEPLSIHKEKKLKNKESDEEMFEDNFDYDEFGDTVDERKSVDDTEVNKVKTRKKKHRKNNRSGAFKHVKMLSNPSLSAENMDDFDQYITVITLTVEEQKEEIMKRKYSSNYLNSPFQCNLCYKGFIDNNAWNHHVSKHSESAGSLECEVCKFRFKTKRAYQKHASGHEKKYACKSCPYVSTNTKALDPKDILGAFLYVLYPKDILGAFLYVLYPKDILGAFLYVLDPKDILGEFLYVLYPKDILGAFLYCEEEIPSAREYWTHFRRVHPDKPYPVEKNHVCDICGKSFRGNAFLVYHKRTHSSERLYKCSQCDKSFYNRSNLHVHEKTHSAARPYPCDLCTRAFKSKGALSRHFRTHTGQKPYECEVCGKGFSQSNSRKLHVRTVHLKQPAPYISRSRLERRKQENKEATNEFMF